MFAKQQPENGIRCCRMSALVGLVVLLSSAAAAEPVTLEALQSLKSRVAGGKDQATEFSEIRAETQKAAALTVGAQGGLKSRNLEIRRLLKARSTQLNTLFNFSQLLIDGRLIPPVIQTGERVFVREGDLAARETGRIYRIHALARISQTPPVWQDYLLLDFPAPARPNEALLPENEQEEARWRVWVRQGWEAGLEQALRVFEQNMARLQRDYTGMLTYHRLAGRGVISSPFLGRLDRGALIEGDTLRIDDRLLRLTRPAEFVAPEDWAPLVEDEALTPLPPE